MTLFYIGESIINTKTHEAGTVIAVLPAGPNCLRNIYIIDEGDNNNYIIVDEDDLVVYDKYYWDDIGTSVVKEVLD